MGLKFYQAIAVLLVSVFGIPSVVLAQAANEPYKYLNQYQQQPPLNEAAPPPQEQPPTNQPTTQPPPPEPVTTPQVQSQRTTPEVSLPVAPTTMPPASQVNSLSLSYYALYAAIIIALLWFTWWRKLLKGKKKPELPAEDDGTVCKTCGGKGMVTKKRKITAPCNHCKQTGRDICHYCSGTGRNGLGYGVPLEDIENYPKCDYCGGKGFPKVVLPCCMCKGKRKEEAWESYEETCPDCKGTGRVAR